MVVIYLYLKREYYKLIKLYVNNSSFFEITGDKRCTFKLQN